VDLLSVGLMLSFRFVYTVLAISSLEQTVIAARASIEGRPKPSNPATAQLSAKFDRRVIGSSLSDRADLSYYTNITIGGVTVEALIDTGRCPYTKVYRGYD
jgi:predicted aspartyl protease